MFRDTQDQLQFPDFLLPFGGKLSPTNRWIRLADLIPWDLVEQAYRRSFGSDSLGSPAKSARIAFGALVIKERLGVTDRETVEQILENPYLQFFLGLTEFRDKPLFNPSMMVHFRSRFSGEDLAAINQRIVLAEGDANGQADGVEEEEDRAVELREDGTGAENSDPPAANGSADEESSERSNSGKLLVDATCTPADITYPTDLKLLNEAREKAEHVIDLLHADLGSAMAKPRDYRRKARKDFLAVAKSKRPGARKIRSAIGKQLRYLRRDLGHIDRQLAAGASLGALTAYEHKCLMVIHTLFEQQMHMYRNRVRRVDDRIVSISQPHVRPIVRGKASTPVEFGAKIAISCVDGYVYLDRLSWDAYHEAGDLPGQIEAYHRRHGCYPDSVHADRIYRTRANRAYCKQRGIRLSGLRPGALPGDADKLAELMNEVRADEQARIPVEGKFGNAKRKGTLARIMAKLSHTAECVIHVGMITLNLDKKLAELLRALVGTLFIPSRWPVTPLAALRQHRSSRITLILPCRRPTTSVLVPASA